MERAEENRRRVVLDVALPGLAEDFALQDGDAVRVFPLSPEVENEVTLHGHAYQTGASAHFADMRVSDLVGPRENLKPEVDLEYAVILRQTGADRRRAVLPFRLGAALDGSEPGENLPLEPRDQVYVFARDRFRPALQARASGQVRTPGTYRIEEGARAADLLRLAGGPTPEALLGRAEVLRYLPDRTRLTLYVDLQSFRNTSLKSSTYNKYPTNYWKYGTCHIKTGTPVREIRNIDKSHVTTRSITLSESFTATPSTNTSFVVFAPLYKEVKDAQCEQTLYILENMHAETLQYYKDIGARGISIGDVNVEFGDGDPSRISLAPVSKKLLSRFIRKQFRIGRA